MRPSWIEIDPGAVEANVREIARTVQPASVCAVVKADGYGHGAVPVAEAAVNGGAAMLAVALVCEAVELREAGVELPILVLSEPSIEDVPAVVEWSLTPFVYREPFLRALAAEAAAGGSAPHPVHLKVDTGMHRVGIDPSGAIELARTIHRDGRLTLEGIATHLPVAEVDAEFTLRQVGTLQRLRRALSDEGIEVEYAHAANTAGALTYPEARLDMVRVGLGVYGLRPTPETAPEVELTPAMRVVSHISHVQRLPAGARPSYGRVRPLARPSTVATVPIGYADGVPRRLSAVGGEVLIHGTRHPFAGTVTMDQVLVDVGDEPVEVGDEVVLIGSQGEEQVTATEWAELTSTINYEIVCGFGSRLRRRYGGGNPA